MGHKLTEQQRAVIEAIRKAQFVPEEGDRVITVQGVCNASTLTPEEVRTAFAGMGGVEIVGAGIQGNYKIPAEYFQ